MSENKVTEVIEVNPQDKKAEILSHEVTVVSVELDSDKLNRAQLDKLRPIKPSAPSLKPTTIIDEAAIKANDAALVSTARVYDDYETAHVVYLPELSDEFTNIQVASVPVTRVSTVENTESGVIETRIEEVSENQFQMAGTRDYSISLEENARAMCLAAYDKFCREEARKSRLYTRSSCVKRHKRQDLDSCIASATVQ